MRSGASVPIGYFVAFLAGAFAAAFGLLAVAFDFAVVDLAVFAGALVAAFAVVFGAVSTGAEADAAAFAAASARAVFDSAARALPAAV